MLPMLYFWKI